MISLQCLAECENINQITIIALGVWNGIRFVDNISVLREKQNKTSKVFFGSSC